MCRESSLAGFGLPIAVVLGPAVLAGIGHLFGEKIEWLVK